MTNEEQSLTSAIGRLIFPSGQELLHLPPVYGRHEARASKGKGKWTVTCSCGSFRACSDDRHFLEHAWGIHRNEIGG